MLVLGFRHNRQLVVLSLDLVYGVRDLLPERLVLVALNSHGRRLNVPMVRSSRTFNFNLFCIFIVDNPGTLVHGLVVGIYFVLIAKRRSHFLLDDGRHHICHLVSQWIQKLLFTFLFLFREGAHRYELLDEPFVGLAQLAKFEVHFALVHYVDHQVAKALVETLAVLL